MVCLNYEQKEFYTSNILKKSLKRAFCLQPEAEIRLVALAFSLVLQG
jgi:hypothetical protein